MRELARRLLAASRDGTDSRGHDASLLSDKLRASLTRFAGGDGFSSLMRRALALASEDVPSLRSVKVTADGRLDGWDRLVADCNAAGERPLAEADVAITAHLLALLITFIGAPFTLKLVREAWPNEPLDEHFSRIEADR